MKRRTFKDYFEAVDIFGFERDKTNDTAEDDSLLMNPIKRFDIELMMDFLSKKKVGVFEAFQNFPNQIQWGGQPGAIRLEVNPAYGFSVKKLAMDKQGNPRWITKKMFQLNRNGFGGYEDSVAQEIFEVIKNSSESNIEAPVEDYKDLDNLVSNIYSKLKRSAKQIFIPEGIKKIHEDAYIIKFGLRAQGLQARDQNRVEQNQVLVTLDRALGTIRITDYNLVSKVGLAHEFKINYNDFDHYFMPTQDRDEISEVIACYMKYY